MLPTYLSQSLTDELIIVQINWDINGNIDIAIDIPVDLNHNQFIEVSTFLVFQRNSKVPLDRIGWFLFQSEIEAAAFGGKPYKYLSSPRVLHHPPSRVESYITLGWQHPSSQLSATNSLSRCQT